jgi:hypothetical protein
MKYGESGFVIVYLLLAVILGIVMLLRANDSVGKKMGLATLILGSGDAFHLVPRVLNYFAEGDFTAALGIGKLVTSVTMTVFYVLLYYIWRGLQMNRTGGEEKKSLTASVWVLFALRILLCLLPQNGWLENKSDMLWGILRNVPFAALGAIVMMLFYGCRKEWKRFRFVWLYICLSFVFYIPVAVGAGIVPMLGMLMLPKTVCYILLIFTFWGYVTKDSRLKR